MPSYPNTMQALVLVESPTPTTPRYDPVEVRTVACPMQTGDGEAFEGSERVVVRVRAAALNHRDVYIREGNYPGVQYGSVLGADGAGEIVDAGKTGLSTGSRVVLFPSKGWVEDPAKPENIFEFAMLGHLPLPGTFAEYISVPAEYAIPIPDHLSFVEAAAFPVAGVTAWRAVFTLGNLQPGQKVLIPGIGGGVALFALQFAVAAGAEVYVTSSSEEKLRKAVALGAKGGVNYRNAKWAEELEAETGGFFDLVVDGAAGPNVKSYMKLLGPGGTLAVYGAVSGSNGSVNFPYLWFKHQTIKGVCMGSLQEFKEMMAFVSKHKIKPVIAGVYGGLSNAEKAFELMREGRQFGKLVVDVTPNFARL
ncbi:hypothetical protein HDU96_002105 [Phlyctochytrium bullatum]|nr:hypothetical protein HDU96_002105 [Phlyctochytrium bullatum]